MFDFKRLRELLRNAFKVSNDKKLSLSGQCSVSYSKHLLSNHTLNGVFHYKFRMLFALTGIGLLA